MSRSPARGKGARPKRAVQSISADADGIGTSDDLSAEHLGEPESATAEREEEYRAIFESTIDGLVILDLDGMIVEANTASCEMLGYTRDELIGLNAIVLTPPEYLPALTESLRSATEGGRTRHYTASKAIRKDGSLLDVESRGRSFSFRGKPHVLAVVRDITERVKAEEQLREKEAQYRSVFEAATDGLVIHDSKGKVVEINPAYCRMLGYTHDELIGQHVSTLIPPEYHHLITEGMQSIGAGDSAQARVVVLRKDGTQLHVDGHGVAFLLNGKPHFLGVTRDITEQIQAEEQLREREAQYRSIFESSLDAIGIVDMEGKLAEVNPAYCEMVGYSRDELIGMPGTALVHPDQHHVNAAAMQTIRRGGEVRTEMILVHKDGALLHVDGRATAFTYRGKPHFLGVSRDITDRVQAEEQLREKEEQYRSIFEATTDGLGIVDMDGNFAEVNPAYCKLTGYSYNELIGAHISTVMLADDDPLIAEVMQSIREGNTIETRPVLVRKDGALLDIEGYATAFTYKGNPHILGVARDITERVKAEQQLREKEAQYRSIFEATTDGLGVVDMEGYIVEVNPAYCQMYGYSRDEVIGLHATALMHPDYHHLIAEGMQSIEMGNPVQVRSVSVRKDGTLFHVDGRATTFLFNGRPHILGVSRDITEQVRAEEQLREREEQYRSIFESSLDAIFIADLEGMVVEANPAACHMYGFSHDELVGQPASALIPPEELSLVREAVESIHRGRSFRSSGHGLRKDGTRFPTEANSTGFTYKGRAHMLGLVRDVTDRVRAEEQRREQEEQYRAIFESTIDGLVILDMEGTIVEANAALCEMLGYTRDELIGLNAAVLTPPERLADLAESLQRAAQEGRIPHNAADKAIRKDGSSLDVETRGRAFTYKGSPHVLAVVRDITERVLAEEQLREKEAQYRSIFESSADGLAIYDQKGFLVEANPAFCQMLGYAHDELIGLHASATVHPDYHHVIAEGLQRSDREKPFRTEVLLLRKDGTSFPAEGGATTFMYKGTPHELVVLRDSSERVEAEKQIREREAEYRGIFEATNDGLIIGDLEGHIVEANPAYCQMFGYTRDELIGLDARQLAAPDYRHVVDEALKAEAASGNYQTVAMGSRKDGSTFYADARGTSFMYRGRPHNLSVVQDVTERMRAFELLEQRVEERTRELSTLLDVSNNVSSTLELQPLMEVILDQLEEVVEYAGASVSLVEGGESRIVAFRGGGSAAVALDVRFPLQQSALFQMWQGAGPLIIDDVRHDDSAQAVAFRKDDAAVMDESFSYVRSWMAVPMVVNERLVGILTLNGAEPGLYTPHHAELVLGIASQAAIAIENARLYERSEQRTRELSTLLNVSKSVSSTLELQPLLDLILDQMAGVVEYAGASISLIDGEESEIVAFRGRGSADVAVGLRIPVEHMDPGPESWRSGPLIIDDVRADTPDAIAYRRNESELLDSSFSYVRSWMAVPLIVNERLAGVLTLNGAEPHLYTPHHAELVLAISQQAAIAIENARLYEKAQQVAALEERQRLARELHDSVSQALFGIGLGARTARALLARDVDKATQSIDYVHSLAQSGMAEMRALIFELRPESLETEGLVQALKKQADAVRARHEILVHPTLCDEPDVPLPVKEALYRIAQEALHNSVKHARPRSVEVFLEWNDREVVLEIRDDGQGFDTRGSFPGHLGLHSMRERAERVGGTVEVESRIGEGTRVRVRVPTRSDK